MGTWNKFSVGLKPIERINWKLLVFWKGTKLILSKNAIEAGQGYQAYFIMG